ncbi:hypothetical protein A3C87_02555 [Candidatus Kaiserbacteria bacterium RIFCSPHIGHO2_02_FULL_49_34]|uniref:PEGA domain-containing protein n=1 Tax=Candidatus Kaiserbacteria bacterium RIFCSPHIGHO2_02_FULL_49_34 TaxID=1798491 RepID=A0A1F6DLQ0_9BACT|nr:MAG: hypothetical protein A3C87_02555 [Candidatus Kaiserbacteria bacterium RIFCSPHIGHO2_02_FULL_49_34]
MAPHAHSLSKRTRTLTFVTLVVVFLVSTPLVWFYASGYRLILADESGAATSTSAIRQTGGLFIGITSADTIFVDDIMERGSRLFSSARYIDGVVAGEHRVHVQREGAHAWVKMLSVSPKLVTEAYAFTLTSNTSVRLVSPRVDTTSTPILRASSTIAATIINDYRVSTVAQTYENSEYINIQKLFTTAVATSTATSTPVVRAQERVRSVRDAVQHIGSDDASEDILATRGDIDVIRRGEDIVVRYSGSLTKLPYYFCADIASTTPCVPEIIMDRQGHAVRDVAFYPATTFDALVLTRDDAVVVTELDPRGGWQNTQPLVLGKGLSTRVDGTRIYIADTVAIYEIVTP